MQCATRVGSADEPKVVQTAPAVHAAIAAITHVPAVKYATRSQPSSLFPLEEFKDFYSAQRVHRALASAARRRAPGAPAALQQFVSSLGGSKVAVCFRLRSPLERQFATDSATRTAEKNA